MLLICYFCDHFIRPFCVSALRVLWATPTEKLLLFTWADKGVSSFIWSEPRLCNRWDRPKKTPIFIQKRKFRKEYFTRDVKKPHWARKHGQGFRCLSTLHQTSSVFDTSNQPTIPNWFAMTFCVPESRSLESLLTYFLWGNNPLIGVTWCVTPGRQNERIWLHSFARVSVIRFLSVWWSQKKMDK